MTKLKPRRFILMCDHPHVREFRVHEDLQRVDIVTREDGTKISVIPWEEWSEALMSPDDLRHPRSGAVLLEVVGDAKL